VHLFRPHGHLEAGILGVSVSGHRPDRPEPRTQLTQEQISRRGVSFAEYLVPESRADR